MPVPGLVRRLLLVAVMADFELQVLALFMVSLVIVEIVFFVREK